MGFMPYSKEHAARIEDRKKYARFRRKNDEFADGIDVIYGITKDGTAEVESIHFDADKFSADEARKWLKDNNYKPIEFAEATGDEGDDEKYWDDEDSDDDDGYEDGDDDYEEDSHHQEPTKTTSIKIEHKNIGFRVLETKEATVNGIKTGIIRGYAATYGDIDRGGDVILKGAFTESLKKYKASKRPIKMQYQHSMMDIIGGFDPSKMVDDEKGLFCEGSINLEVQRGREAYALAKQGMLTDFSIGYSVDEEDYIRPATASTPPIRQLKKITLWEISMVGEPMNPNAKVTEVKKMSVREVTKLVAAAQITKKSQLARILRKSGSFTKSGVEYLVNLIHFEDTQSDSSDKEHKNMELIGHLHAINENLKNISDKKEHNNIINSLRSIKNIIAS